MKICYLIALAVSITSLHARDWTNAAGKTITADFGGVEGSKVILKLKKKTYKVPLISLSQADQDYVRATLAEAEVKEQEAAELLRTQGHAFGETFVKAGELKTTLLDLSDEDITLAKDGGKGWKFSWAQNYSGAWIKDIAEGHDVSQTNALIGLPNNFDPSKPTPIFIQWTSTDSKHNVGGARSYRNSCLDNGFILLAVDAAPDHKAAWSYPVFLANINTALAEVHKQWPGSDEWPIVCGGFSGGSKISQIMAPLIAQQGHDVRGFYMGGCNETFFDLAKEDYRVKKPTLRKLKAYFSSGTKDHLVADKHRTNVRNGLKEGSLKDFKCVTYDGGHSIDQGQFVEGLKWILAEEE